MPTTQDSSTNQSSLTSVKEYSFIEYLQNSDLFKTNVAALHKQINKPANPASIATSLNNVFGALPIAYGSNSSETNYRAFSQANEDALYQLYEQLFKDLVVPKMVHEEFLISLSLATGIKAFIRCSIQHAVHALLDINGHLKAEISDLIGITQTLPNPTTEAYRHDVIYPLVSGFVNQIIIGNIVPMYHEKNSTAPSLANSYIIPSHMSKLFQSDPGATNELISDFCKQEIATTILNQCAFSETNFYQYLKTVSPTNIEAIVTADIDQMDKPDEQTIQATFYEKKKKFWSNLALCFKKNNDTARHDAILKPPKNLNLEAQEHKHEHQTHTHPTPWFNARDNQFFLDAIGEHSTHQQFTLHLKSLKNEVKLIAEKPDQFVKLFFKDKQLIQFKDAMITSLNKLNQEELKRSFSLGLVNNGERPIPVYVKLGLWNDLTGYLLNHDKNAVTVDEKAMLNHYRSELVSTLKSYKLNVTVDKQIECIQSVIDRKNALGTILATPTSNLGFLASWTLGATCTNSIQILIDHQKELESRQSTCESTPQI